MRKRSFIVNMIRLCIILISILGCNESEFIKTDFDVTKQALEPFLCSITVGEGSQSEVLSHTFENTSGSVTLNTEDAYSFIRATSGPCKFTVYNESNGGGRYVIIGTDLDGRIRAGLDGVRCKDGDESTYCMSSDSEMWRVRSVKIEPVSVTSCYLNIGGGGVRMNYYPGEYERVPAMDRMTYFLGGNCDAKAWNEVNFALAETPEDEDDYYNRFVGLHVNARTVAQGLARSIYDPGFRIRSMKISLWGISNNTYVSTMNYDFGRWLPSYVLTDSIYSINSGDDLDQDGLNDYQEDLLADAFRPIVLNHETELIDDFHGTRANVYADFQGNPVHEPVAAFQVRKSSTYPENMIEIIYMQYWLHDKGSDSCSGHNGDSQAHIFHLKTEPSGENYGKFWYLYATSNNVFESIPIETNSNAVGDVQDISLTAEEMQSVQPPIYQTVAEQEAMEREAMLNGTYITTDEQIREYHHIPAYIADADKNIERMASLDNTISPLQNTGVSNGNLREFLWKQGDTHIRAPMFDRMVNETAHTNRHLVIYYSKGKHHDFQDTSWSGYEDTKYCGSLTSHIAYVNGRGELCSTPLPRRLLSLRSPAGAGDRYNYNNVGSRDHFNGFMNDLEPFGFLEEDVWGTGKFYSAAPADRHFLCSNNVDKNCTLDSSEE